MKKQTGLVLSLVVVVAGVVAYGALSKKQDAKHAEFEPVAATHELGKPVAGKVVRVTKVGTVGCLKPKTTGATARSCAIGITDSSGTAYALYTASASQTRSLVTGKKIQVTGTLVTGASQYQMAGTITAQSIKHL